MLKIVVPMAGESPYFKGGDFKFSKAFVEISGRPMIQLVVENLMKISCEKRFIFVVNESDIKRYKLDNVLRMLTNDNCDIVSQASPTKGAVCSLLLAIRHLNQSDPLLISNSDQLIQHDLNAALNFYYSEKVDGGVVCFNSIHPHWSYARDEDGDNLIETAEKKPISQNAIAGLYYFASGAEFINSAMKSITKDQSCDGFFYISSVLNEMILENKKLKIYRIDSSEYHSFYSPQKIKEFEDLNKI